MNRTALLLCLVLALLTPGCTKRSTDHEPAPNEAAAHADEHKGADEHGHAAEDKGHAAEAEGRIELAPETRAASGIEVAAAEPRLIRATLDLPGEAVPNADRLAHIVPRFPGIAREVRKGLGDYVREGEVLAVIEGNQSLSTYEVRSLISGTVIEKHLTLGEFVRDDQDIYVVADLSTVWVNIAIYARDVARVRPGQKVMIATVGEGPSAEGVIGYIGPVVGEATRAATARVEIPNRSLSWRPGTFITARIVLAESRAQVAVPDAAIQRVEGRDCVFVEDGDGFVARPVTIGATDGDWNEILSGLAAGERYVVRGSFVLKSELQKSEASHAH
jgi:cobalt-zinc-cadmium efflux system membrane fusion protein